MLASGLKRSGRALHDHAVRSVRDVQAKQLKVDLGGKWQVMVMSRGPESTRELRKLIHRAETVDEVLALVENSARTPDVLRAAMQRCGRLRSAEAVKQLFSVRPFESVYHVNVAMTALCRARDPAAAKDVFLKAFHAMDMPVDRVTFCCALHVFASETPPLITPARHFCDQVWEDMESRGVLVPASLYVVRVLYLTQTRRHVEAMACLESMMKATRENDWAGPGSVARRLTGFSGFTRWQLLRMLQACNIGGGHPSQLKDIWAFAVRANAAFNNQRALQETGGIGPQQGSDPTQYGSLTSSQAVAQLAISYLKHGNHREALSVCKQLPDATKDFKYRLVEAEALLVELFTSRSQESLLALRKTVRDAEHRAAGHWENRPASVDRAWMAQLVAVAHRVASSDVDLDETTRWYAKALPDKPQDPLRRAGKRLPPGLGTLPI